MSSRSRCFSVPSLSIAAIVLCSVSVRPAHADTVFDVSGTFDDNNSTPLVGTITLGPANTLDGFFFDIPSMTIGSTALAGALFTPSTATASFDDFGPAAFLNFQLFGAPPEGEELFLLIPEPIATPFEGSSLLQAVSSGGQVFHTGYQSGPQSNPFFELAGNGTITPAAAPEPSSYLFLGLGVAGILLKRHATSRG
jgi:hypothetical protein